MTENDWNEIEVKKITSTNNEDSDIVFVLCATMEDASKITSKAANLPKNNKENDPRIIMFVDKKAKKRYDAIQNVAKTMRY